MEFLSVLYLLSCHTRKDNIEALIDKGKQPYDFVLHNPKMYDTGSLYFIAL